MKQKSPYANFGTKNGNYSHGYSCGPFKKEFFAFKEAKRRCTNEAFWCYKYYGGRGIQFKFVDFDQFIAAVGAAPTPEHTLDRINTDGHYEPGNVRWATRHEQVLNRRPRNTTHCRHGHEYTPENTFINVRGKKECRTCIKARKINARELRARSSRD